MSTAIVDTARPAAARRDRARLEHRARLARQASPRLRMTRRGRSVLAVVVALPLVAVAWFALGPVDGAIATDQPSTVSFEYVQVESGQSLWQIASAVAPAEDPRDVVSEIVRLNGLVSSDVFPGQRLGVPEQYRS